LLKLHDLKMMDQLAKRENAFSCHATWSAILGQNAQTEIAGRENDGSYSFQNIDDEVFNTVLA